MFMKEFKEKMWQNTELVVYARILLSLNTKTNVFISIFIGHRCFSNIDHSLNRIYLKIFFIVVNDQVSICYVRRPLQ